MKTIYHITTEDAWKRAQEEGVYKGDTLESQGFIHCSTREQVEEVANHLFKGQDNLVLLTINEDGVNAPVKYEDGGDGNNYPHIYGPLNLEAVMDTQPLEPDSQGNFKTPEEK